MKPANLYGILGRMARLDLETCPNCHYTLLERSTYCPYCGEQLTHSVCAKTGAWILLILIVYGLVTCHVRMLDGLQNF